MQIHKLLIIAPFFLLSSSHAAPTTKAAKHPLAKPAAKVTLSAPVAPPAPAAEPPAAPAPPTPAPPPLPQSFPLAPYGTYANAYAPFNCTSYVASRVQIPNSWGNANMWAINAQAQGITVSATPLAGAIGQTTRGMFGHVVVVLEVDNGQILIAEQNYDYQGSIRERWAEASEFTYIYL